MVKITLEVPQKSKIKKSELKLSYDKEIPYPNTDLKI
jgi:hypothetical protein